MTGRRITKVFPAYVQESVIGSVSDVAERRTLHLESLVFRHSIQQLLVSAYMQGVRDMCDAVIHEETRRCQTHQ